MTTWVLIIWGAFTSQTIMMQDKEACTKALRAIAQVDAYCLSRTSGELIKQKDISK